ncbi:hypothetical protein LTR27_009636 [Elasticomyces elasticus]|nr:hypothetical protein LTR27_009636 [Elasticomyces elasticus]
MSKSVLPQGSLILVTGANGSVGGAVSLQILKAGYHLRAVVRNEEKGGYLREGLKAQGYDEESVQVVLVPDMAAPGSLDEALKGCIAIAHVASDVSFGHNPNEVITPTLALLQSVLESAAKTASIKRFVRSFHCSEYRLLLTRSLTQVYTSSTGVLPLLDQKVHLTPSSWVSSTIVDKAWSEPYGPENKATIYCASKYLSEKACWDFVRDRKPHFELNVVVPNSHVGAFLHPKLVGSLNGIIWGMWIGDEFAVSVSHMIVGLNGLINLEDSGLLHLAALTQSDVSSERLLGIGEVFTHDDLIDVMAKIDPDRKLPPKMGKDCPVAHATVDMERSFELTRRMGKAKWAGVEESVRQLVDSMAPYV